MQCRTWSFCSLLYLFRIHCRCYCSADKRNRMRLNYSTNTYKQSFPDEYFFLDKSGLVSPPCNPNATLFLDSMIVQNIQDLDSARQSGTWHVGGRRPQSAQIRRTENLVTRIRTYDLDIGSPRIALAELATVERDGKFLIDAYLQSKKTSQFNRACRRLLDMTITPPTKGATISETFNFTYAIFLKIAVLQRENGVGIGVALNNGIALYRWMRDQLGIFGHIEYVIGLNRFCGETKLDRLLKSQRKKQVRAACRNAAWDVSHYRHFLRVLDAEFFSACGLERSDNFMLLLAGEDSLSPDLIFCTEDTALVDALLQFNNPRFRFHYRANIGAKDGSGYSGATGHILPWPEKAGHDFSKLFDEMESDAKARATLAPNVMPEKELFENIIVPLEMRLDILSS